MKLKTTRRKFFGLMAASPLAAKKAAEASAKELIHSGDMYGGPDVASMPTTGMDGNEIKSDEFMRKLLSKGLPQWKLDEIREEESGYTPRLDADIAQMRSWSLVAKYAAQRERNVQRKIKNVYKNFDSGIFRNARREFEEKTGWWL